MLPSKAATLEQTEQSIFFAKPAHIHIDETARAKYESLRNIDALIQELKENGPLVGLGKIGPDNYVEAPFKLASSPCGKAIYGWKRGAERLYFSKQNSFMVLGAKKIDGGHYVYFTLSLDVTPSTKVLIRRHKPVEVDGRIFVVSHKTFQETLCAFFSPFSGDFKSNGKKMSFDKQLCTLPLYSILDDGITEAKCKAIGQNAFNRFKQETQGNTWVAKAKLTLLWESIETYANDGLERKDEIRRAWVGVGDDAWQWQT